MKQEHIVKQILIVDDHPVLRQGLAILINQEKDLKVCAEAEDLESSKKKLSELAIDLVLLDISLQSESGLDVLTFICNYYPQVHVLILSMYDEKVYAERSLRAGAKGYICKQSPPEKILHAIRTVGSGEIYLSQSMFSDFTTRYFQEEKSSSTADSPLSKLTKRELEIFQRLGEELSIRQISKKLHISIKTVETHKLNIREKLKLQSGNEVNEVAKFWVIKGCFPQNMEP